MDLLPRRYQPGILWAGVGNVYAENHIHDAPHNAILGGGNEATCSGNGTETVIVEAGSSTRVVLG